jgi:tetratricopeptide (TPR) repeat protein
MRTLILILALTALAVPAFPQAPQSRGEALAALKSADVAKRAEAIVWIANRGLASDGPLLEERLRDASPFVRAYAEQGLWRLWGRSGDADIDRRMATGVEQMQAGRYPEALAAFSEVISRKPDFAEAWNKRATVYYLAGDYARSIADCNEVLKRNPSHFGALSGLGQIYFKLEQYEQALAWFRRALEVNPNLSGVEENVRGLEALLRENRT